MQLRHPDGTVHFSDVKLFSRSAAHYRHAVTHPREPSRPMRIGTIVDRLIFGGDVPVCPLDERRGNVWECFCELAQGFTPIVYPGATRQGKAWKDFAETHKGTRLYTQREFDEAFDLVAALPAGRTYQPSEFVTWSELGEAEPMAEALRGSPLAMRYLEGRHQVALEWESQGVRCSTRGIDCVGFGFISDLKVTQTTEPFHWCHQARRMLWHAQLAWYAEGCRAHGIDTHHGLFLVGVESSAPYPVTVLRLTERAAEEGARCCHSWLEQLRACEASGDWPAYAQSVVDFDIEPAFELTGVEDEAPVELCG